jgi:hypothetical protein
VFSCSGAADATRGLIATGVPVPSFPAFTRARIMRTPAHALCLSHVMSVMSYTGTIACIALLALHLLSAIVAARVAARPATGCRKRFETDSWLFFQCWLAKPGGASESHPCDTPHIPDCGTCS